MFRFNILSVFPSRTEGLGTITRMDARLPAPFANRACFSHMRLFLAIGLPSEVRAALEACQDQIRMRLTGVRCAWARPEDLHLTLLFLGDAPGQSAASIGEIAARVGRAADPFRVSIGGLGFFGSEDRGRYRFAIWAGLEGQTECAAVLAGSLHKELAAFEERPQGQRFVPHITLGRIKRADRSLRPVLQTTLQRVCLRAGRTWTVDEFQLIESIREAKGHTYRTVQSFDLRES